MAQLKRRVGPLGKEVKLRKEIDVESPKRLLYHDALWIAGIRTKVNNNEMVARRVCYYYRDVKKKVVDNHHHTHRHHKHPFEEVK